MRRFASASVDASNDPSARARTTQTRSKNKHEHNGYQRGYISCTLGELDTWLNTILRSQLIEATCIGNPFLSSNPLCNWSHIWTVAIPIRAPPAALAETSWKGNLQWRPLMRFVTKVDSHRRVFDKTINIRRSPSTGKNHFTTKSHAREAYFWAHSSLQPPHILPRRLSKFHRHARRWVNDFPLLSVCPRKSKITWKILPQRDVH